MKFVTNTKPLCDALTLGVINANISDYHMKSTVIQVTASRNQLKFNIETNRILTEIVLKGSGDSEDTVSMFVGSLLLKQIVATLDTPTVTLEFVDGGIVLHSGKSRFTIPKMINESEIGLNVPVKDTKKFEDKLDIKKDDWKFILDNQMYAIAMSFIHPAYTRVWVGDSGDVLVGDFDNSLFTHSKHGNLNRTCMLSDTVINLLTSLPDGATLESYGRDYIINYECDSYTYVTQFTPFYEDEEGVGSYNSTIFLDMMSKSKVNGDVFTIKGSSVKKFLGQASLFSPSKDATIKFIKSGYNVSLVDNNVDCSIDITGDCRDFELEFKLEYLNKVISSYSEDLLSMSPVINEGDVVGILVWTDELTTVFAGVE